MQGEAMTREELITKADIWAMKRARERGPLHWHDLRDGVIAGFELGRDACAKVGSEALAKCVLDAVWTDAYNMALKYHQDREAAKRAAVTWMASNLEIVLGDEIRALGEPGKQNTQELGGGGR
jgi:hypothetical protein